MVSEAVIGDSVGTAPTYFIVGHVEGVAGRSFRSGHGQKNTETFFTRSPGSSGGSAVGTTVITVRTDHRSMSDNRGERATPAEREAMERIEEDPYCASLGIEFTTLEPGYAEATLTASEDMCNFNGKLHGGVVFGLADATGGAAVNAVGETAIGLETSTSFLTAVDAGETITARAELTHTSRKTTLVTVEVLNEDNELVANFTGRGYKFD